MEVTIRRLGAKGPPAKRFEGYVRFLCPNCKEMRATINPKNNLSHCFCCGSNYNNIDLLMELGYDFLSAIAVLEAWLEQHQTSATKQRSSV